MPAKVPGRHYCTTRATSLRWLKKPGKEGKLQQYRECVECGRGHWEEVPVVIDYGENDGLVK